MCELLLYSHGDVLGFYRCVNIFRLSNRAFVRNEVMHYLFIISKSLLKLFVLSLIPFKI